MNQEIVLEPYQSEFFESQSRYPAFVAAWGTGKTYTALLKAIDISLKYPNNLGLILRKRFTDLKSSTMLDFEQLVQAKIPTSKDFEFDNGSKIMFRHLDEFQSGVVQNINLGWFFIEQAEEFDSSSEFDLLRGRLRRKNVPLRQGFIIANTLGHNWVWKLWKKGELKNAHLTEAQSWDNPHLPIDFIDDLKEMETEAPARYRRFVLNSWDDVDTDDAVLDYNALLDAVGKELFNLMDMPTLVTCDPAELGSDKTVIFAMKGYEVIDSYVGEKKEAMETAGHIVAMCRKHSAHSAVIDATGIGAGICSRVRELGIDAMRLHYGQGSSDKEQWKGIKEEMWMTAKQVLSDGKLSLPNADDGIGAKLLEDLTSQHYSVNSSGRVELEKKKEIKKRLGRSPDFGDAFIQGVWRMTQLEQGQSIFEDDDHEDMSMADSYSVKSAF